MKVTTEKNLAVLLSCITLQIGENISNMLRKKRKHKK